MNAAETIQAAIDKLDEWRALSWPCASWTQNAVRHIARNCEIECYDEAHEDEWGWDRYETGPAIYGLSQTIDAQLVILRAALEDFEGSHDEPGAFMLALDLARAILGEATS